MNAKYAPGIHKLVHHLGHVERQGHQNFLGATELRRKWGSLIKCGATEYIPDEFKDVV